MKLIIVVKCACWHISWVSRSRPRTKCGLGRNSGRSVDSLARAKLQIVRRLNMADSSSRRNSEQKLEAGGMARKERALRAHVIAAQFAKRVGHEFCSHTLAPGHVEIGVVERLGDARSERSSFGNGFLIQPSAHQESRGFCSYKRQTSDRADDNAR